MQRQNHHRRRTTPMTYVFQANPRKTTSLLPSFSYLFLTFNSIGTIFRAYFAGQKWLLAFIFFIYSSFFLLEYCFSEYGQLPRKDKSGRRNFLGVAIWCLFTGIVFGFSYQFAQLFTFPLAASLYAVAFAASAIMFHVYIIYDGEESGDCHTYNTTENIWFSWENVEIVLDKV